MFKKQTLIFIVPDNNPAEYASAKKLAEWLDAEVRYFPETMEHNADYIDYRKTKSVDDFRREVLGVLPYDDITQNQVFPSLQALYDVGDRLRFAEVYLEMLAKGISWADAAICMANHHVTDKTSRRQFYNVKCKEDFIFAMGSRPKTGVW